MKYLPRRSIRGDNAPGRTAVIFPAQPAAKEANVLARVDGERGYDHISPKRQALISFLPTAQLPVMHSPFRCAVACWHEK